MSQLLLLGILAHHAIVQKDPFEPHRDPWRILNLGIITCKGDRDYDGGSEWRSPEFLQNAQKSIHKLC